MLSREENDLLTQTGPGTPMGELMRRYWMPALLSSELPAPDSDPKPLMLLGERLVAYRDATGRVGLLAEGCPHRGASLGYARSEGCGLRCIYHGWMVDVDGRILETPTEPPTSDFKERVRHVAYPTHEVGGMLWTYLGPPEHQPAFPSWEWTAAPRDRLDIGKVLQDCNYAQGLEGSIDSAHSDYLHSSDIRGRPSDHAPRLEAEDTPYGFRYAAIRRPDDDSDRRKSVRVTLFVAPFFVFIPPQRRGHQEIITQHVWVPTDDAHNHFYSIRLNRLGPLAEDHFEQFHMDAQRRPARRRDNQHLQDRAAMRRGNWSGVDGINSQDFAVVESMGAVYDRTREHLGLTDVAVIRYRRRMIDAARAFQAGEPPLGLDAPVDYPDLHSEERVVPIDLPWQQVLTTPAYVTAE